MSFEIEYELHNMKRPEKTQTGNPEKDYYLDIIYKLELNAYDNLRSRKRNPSGNLGNTKENRWKESSAEFFNSLASQGRAWLDGGSTFPNPWSFKQWKKICTILRDSTLRPYQEKIESEKHKAILEELNRKAAAYDALTNGHSSPEICTDTEKNPDWNMVHDLDECYM